MSEMLRRSVLRTIWTPGNIPFNINNIDSRIQTDQTANDFSIRALEYRNVLNAHVRLVNHHVMHVNAGSRLAIFAMRASSKRQFRRVRKNRRNGRSCTTKRQRCINWHECGWTKRTRERHSRHLQSCYYITNLLSVRRRKPHHWVQHRDCV